MQRAGYWLDRRSGRRGGSVVTFLFDLCADRRDGLVLKDMTGIDSDSGLISQRIDPEYHQRISAQFEDAVFDADFFKV